MSGFSHSMLAYRTGGGGSGGSIYINSIQTYLASGCRLIADGGPGQYAGSYLIGFYSWQPYICHQYRRRGRRGGRIKIYKHPYSSNQLFINGGANLSAAGGASGGGGSPIAATNGLTGQSGSSSFIQGYIPYATTLQSPMDSSTVGLEPTLLLIPRILKPQFIKYEIQLDTSTTFATSNLVDVNQLTPDAGWSGQPYYKSGQMAFLYYSIVPHRSNT